MEKSYRTLVTEVIEARPGRRRRAGPERAEPARDPAVACGRRERAPGDVHPTPAPTVPR